VGIIRIIVVLAYTSPSGITISPTTSCNIFKSYHVWKSQRTRLLYVFSLLLPIIMNCQQENGISTVLITLDNYWRYDWRKIAIRSCDLPYLNRNLHKMCKSFNIRIEPDTKWNSYLPINNTIKLRTACTTRTREKVILQ
jgi:hypothetical protein